MRPFSFTGTTERGRSVRDESLDACVDALAFVMNRVTADLVTVQDPGDQSRWLVYADQAAADTDVNRGERCNWIAIVRQDGGS